MQTYFLSHGYEGMYAYIAMNLYLFLLIFLLFIMTNNIFLRTARTLPLFVFIIFLLNSCSEEHSHGPGEHFEAEGALFLDGSRAPYLQIFRGQVDPAFKTTFKAPLNNLSDAFIVKFLDADKKEKNPPTDPSVRLTWKIANTDIVEVYQHEGEEGGYEFHLRGKKTGTTTIEFYLTHGDHSDYRTGTIPVEVVKDSTTIEDPILKYIDEESGEEYANADTKGKVSGGVTVAANDTTDHIEAEIENRDGTVPKLDAAEYFIVVTTEDPTIATIIPPTNDEPFAFNIVGKKKGATKFMTKLYRKIEGKDAEIASFARISIDVQ